MHIQNILYNNLSPLKIMLHISLEK
jgi:hypothetical protein